MRFLILRRADAQTEQGVMPGDELLAAMGSYNQQLVDAGVMRAGEGIRPSAEGVRLVLGPGGQERIEHGPFPDDQLVAGFSVFDAASREEAIEWIKRWPAQDGGGDVTIEIREAAAPTDAQKFARARKGQRDGATSSCCARAPRWKRSCRWGLKRSSGSRRTTRPKPPPACCWRATACAPAAVPAACGSRAASRP